MIESSATEVNDTAGKYKGTKMDLIKFHKIMKGVNKRFEGLNYVSNTWLILS